MELRWERTVADVAKSLGVPENMLHQWRKKLGSQIADTSEEAREQELKRLRRNSSLARRAFRERVLGAAGGDWDGWGERA